ncbi:CCDC50 N domain containing protein [Trichuris trichiura]|uniref:CCDC50 N domain containing protein n=1 Tax=Trichuris trichiura TaxID=36087 RepID=A0A077Z1F2_TRITR|nr:CCDC50 N domain containing protein [Trichuris trichiura]
MAALGSHFRKVGMPLERENDGKEEEEEEEERVDLSKGWSHFELTAISGMERMVAHVDASFFAMIMVDRFLFARIVPTPSAQGCRLFILAIIVRRQWREVEDFSLAQKLQEVEFQKHYNYNREERQNMGADVRLSKREQLAEECRYRMERLNQEKEDEKLAAQLQQQLDIEDMERRSRLECKDYEYAKSLTENSSSSSTPIFSPPQSATTGYSSASELSIISPNGDSSSLNLLEGSVREKSIRLAELSDYELALRLQNEEACAAVDEQQQRNTKEQSVPVSPKVFACDGFYFEGANSSEERRAEVLA